MSKFWLICKYEYLRHVRRKRFIFALLSMPMMIVLMGGTIFLMAMAEYDRRPVGYVDLTGVLANARQLPVSQTDWFPDPVIQPFADEPAARSALDKGELQGYYVLPAQYLNDGSARYVTSGQQKPSTETAFRNFMKYNLVNSQPPDVAKRVVNGPIMEIRSLDGSRKMGENDFLGILIPMIVGILFLLVINTSGNYLVGALVEEKENRMMEIMVTSVSTSELMAGKVVGNLAVGLTELITWVVFGMASLAVIRGNAPEQTFNLDAGYLWLCFFTLLPAFVMIAGLMATAGVTTTDTREAQQIAGLFTLPVVVPFWLLVPLMESPNSVLSVGLSLFPLTAPVSLTMRAAFTDVPAWQIAASLGLLFLSAVGAIWLASRAFRLGMLRYGKRLSWREIFGRA